MWRRVYWLVCGALLGLALVSTLTIGVVVFPFAAAMLVVGLCLRALRNRAALMMLSGAALVPLYVAWLNRGGPGQVCTVHGDVTECFGAWSPWPFVAVAAGMVAANVVALAATRSRDRRPTPAKPAA